MCWVIPPLGGTDERAHYLRLVTVDEGWLIPPLDEEAAADYVVPDCVATFVMTGRAPHRTDSDSCGSPVLARCLAPPEVGCPDEANIFAAILAAEPYPPVVYAPAWVGYRIGGMGDDPIMALRWARMTQLFTYVVLGALAIRIAPWGKPFFFGVALLPVVVQTASTVSADALTNGVALVATALTLELVHRGRSGGPPTSGRRLAAWGAAFVLLGMSKPGYAPMALAAAVVPMAAFGSWRRRVVTVVAILGLVAVTNLLWTVGVASHLDEPMRAGTDPLAQTEWVTNHPAAFLTSVGRTWANTDALTFIAKGAVVPVSRLTSKMDIPWWLWSATAVALAGAYVADMGGRSSRLRVVRRASSAVPEAAGGPRDIAADDTRDTGDTGDTEPLRSQVDWWAAGVVSTIALVLVLVITYAMALAANPVAPAIVKGIQGRYFIPLLPLCLLVSRTRRRDVPATQVLWLPIGCVLLLGWWLSVLRA